jgi:hypothetical protein
MTPRATLVYLSLDKTTTAYERQYGSSYHTAVYTATLISFPTLVFALYLLFITATAENPASHKYDVENGIKIR